MTSSVIGYTGPNRITTTYKYKSMHCTKVKILHKTH